MAVCLYDYLTIPVKARNATRRMCTGKVFLVVRGISGCHVINTKLADNLRANVLGSRYTGWVAAEPVVTYY